MSDGLIDVRTIRSAFEGAVAQVGGSIAGVYDDGRRLFARALLPSGGEVTPGDRVRGGIALHAGDGNAGVYPYLYRLVCRNGAIMALALGVKRVEWSEWADPAVVEAEVREEVCTCAAPDVAEAGLDRMRGARARAVDNALTLLSMFDIDQLPGRFLDEILDRFADEGDGTEFGLMNAVTATARDVPDHALRWQLEKLGGAIAAGRSGPRSRPFLPARPAQPRGQTPPLAHSSR
jgi:hypothetical protein